MEKNYGLIVPEIQSEHWVLGGGNVPGEVINPDGNWLPYLPAGEPQNIRDIETQNCTGYGTLNAIETLLAFKGVQANYSDRYLGIEANTDQFHGNDPHTVVETVRKISGCLPESLLPFSSDIETAAQYYTPRPMTAALVKKGNEWYNAWDLAHEWVFTSGTPADKRARLKDALTKGPVCVSVTAWYFDPARSVYYKPQGASDNHWCQLVAVKDDCYLIFDSYDGYLKRLDPSFDFAIAKIYYLTPAQPKLSWIQSIINWIRQTILPDLQKKVDEKAPITSPVVPPVIQPSIPTGGKIEAWAKAIQNEEGKPGDRNYQNNNPGNLKYTPYTASLGATSHDSGNFCVFPSHDQGMAALCQFLRDACNGKLKSYKPEMTLAQFTEIYALPPANHPYALNVANAIGVKVDTQIKSLL